MNKLVLKIGSSTLTQGTDRISRGKIEDIAKAIRDNGQAYDIILVSSGAIAAARQFLKLDNKIGLKEKQAMAAIGQVHLMRIYYEVFKDFGISMSQCLLSYYDLSNPTSCENVRNTIRTLLDFGYVPIINENDTVATEEIQFGDNDKLAAMVANLVGANKLVLVTDTNGVYDKDPKIFNDAKLLTEILDPSSVLSKMTETKSTLGSGGMKSKLIAAQWAQLHGIETLIVNGNNSNFLSDALEGRSSFTKVSVL